MNYDPSALSMHARYLLACARRLTRNDADARDLVQDACVQALEALQSPSPPPSNLRAWLLTIMRNHWFNVVRHRKVRATARAELVHLRESDSRLNDVNVLHSQLLRAWGELPVQAQNIAQQCLIDGDSHELVSSRFGITAGGVATSIHRTREQLRISMFGT
jgi:RNA polymerase sigma factor (sigma-70 family)